MIDQGLFSPELQARIDNFYHEARPVIMEPDGFHSVFVVKEDGSEIHGQKRDWDKIASDTPLYDEWMDVEEQAIREIYGKDQPTAVLGIANGTNRVARSQAERLGCGVSALETVKLPSSEIILSAMTETAVRHLRPRFVLIAEDESTTGTSVAYAARALLALGVERVEMITTAQRSEALPFLDGLIKYSAMILDPQPNFEKVACETLDEGFCKQGWRLKRYGSNSYE